MAYHIIIAQERRSAVVTELGIDTSRLAIDSDGQLHIHSDAAMPEKDWSDEQFIMVVEWDLQSPYVILHKGDYSARTMSYSGWPELTKEQYDALPRPDPL